MKKLLLLFSILSMTAFAVDNTGNVSVTSDSIIIGEEAEAEDGGISIGNNSAADEDSVAIGFDAKGDVPSKDKQGDEVDQDHPEASTLVGAHTRAGHSSVAFGIHAKSIGARSIAIGPFATTNENISSIAIGSQADVDGEGSILVGANGTVYGKYSMAFGQGNLISAENSGAFGNDNNIKGENTFVIGNNITTEVKNAVILGANSTGVDNAVSVGSDKNQRRIVNLAKGTSDTDAVNVAQAREMIKKESKKLSRGIATTAALSGLDITPSKIGKTKVATSIGTYNSNMSVAVGFGRKISTSSSINAKIAISGISNITTTTGFSYEF